MKFIQWFPGHMTKAMRMMQDCVPLVDGVMFVLDARAPAATFNKKLKALVQNKPVLYILNKADLADGAKTDAFLLELNKGGALAVKCAAANASSAAKQISAKALELLQEKRARDAAKGLSRPLRFMVAGIPNTGKSTVINALAGGKRAVTGDKAGVTRGKQWIRCAGFELLDTPGTMPPSFENQTLAQHLAYIGSINDDILDFYGLSLELLRELAENYPALLKERYAIEEISSPAEMLGGICKRRGFVLRGGEYDLERGARALIDDFRKGRIGKITLERAADYVGFFG